MMSKKEKEITAKTLFVRNLPKNIKANVLNDTFSEIGPVKKAHVVKDKAKKEIIGVGYVTFAFNDDAEIALKKTFKIGGNVLELKYANKKTDVENPYNVKRKIFRTEKWKKVSKEKKPRIIIRNLSFKVNEKKLKEKFSQFGTIKEVNIPINKENNLIYGYAFITYENVNNALKAIKEMNAKNFIGRPIAVDYAIPKKNYETFSNKNDDDDDEKEENGEYDFSDLIRKECSKNDANETKQEKNKSDIVQEENDDEDDGDEGKDDIEMEDEEEMDNDEENGEDEEDGDEGIDEKESEDNEEEKDDDDEDNEEEKEDDDDEEEDDDDDEDSHGGKNKLNVKKNLNSDVNEEKTVFIRNIPFETTEDKLNKLLKTFGETKYCKICKDEFTGYSRGTAFAKFLKKTSAEKCIEENESFEHRDKFTIDGKKLQITIALSKQELKREEELKNGKNRDKRNLYLSREGFIAPESEAAKGVSEQDLQKRLNLENKKRKMLQNLHHFVSKTRLCIHNLPSNVGNNQLRDIFLKAVNDKRAKIIEARVMYKVLKDGKKFGSSSGFGFVEFNEHRYALIALRKLNNNPEIFTYNERPIVEFTVENMVALNKKKWRMNNKLNKKVKNKDDPHEERVVNIRDLYDIEIEDKPYMGFKARRMKDGEKIHLPKINKKMLELGKKVNDLRKRKRTEKKFIEKKKERSMNLKKKHINISEHRNLQKEKVVKEVDDFEEKYLKRNPSLNENKNKKLFKPKIDESKRWFNH